MLQHKQISQRLRRSQRATRQVAFVAGAQRSGTNMIMEIIERSLDSEVFHENDPRAFDYYELRNSSVLDALRIRSDAPRVVFKALCESQDLNELLRQWPGAKAVWVYRHYEPVIRSHMKIWDHIPSQIGEIAAVNDRTGGWMGRGISDATLAFVRECYHDDLSNASACALLWYIRNILFFEQSLTAQSNTYLLSYERLVADPEAGTRQLFAFLGLTFRPKCCDFISPRHAMSETSSPIEIEPRIRQACDDLLLRLDEVVARREAMPGTDAEKPSGP